MKQNNTHTHTISKIVMAILWFIFIIVSTPSLKQLIPFVQFLIGLVYLVITLMLILAF